MVQPRPNEKEVGADSSKSLGDGPERTTKASFPRFNGRIVIFIDIEVSSGWKEGQ